MWCGLQASMRCTSPERSSRLSMDATLAYALEIAVHTPRAQMLCVADEMRLVARSEGLTLRQKTVAFPSRQISALHLYADHLVPGAKARLLQMSLYSSARGFGGIPKHSVGVTCLSAANISSLNMPACPRIVRRGIEYAEVCLSVCLGAFHNRGESETESRSRDGSQHSKNIASSIPASFVRERVVQTQQSRWLRGCVLETQFFFLLLTLVRVHALVCPFRDRPLWEKEDCAISGRC